MLAAGHFQDTIDPPSKFDVVIFIVESRLGPPMPERTQVREYRGMDGRTPVTGTEWEYEDALAAKRERGVPDILVYRSRRKVELNTWDVQNRQAALNQMEAVDMFCSRVLADGDTSPSGCTTFNTLEDFANKLQSDLRRCLERRFRTTD